MALIFFILAVSLLLQHPGESLSNRSDFNLVDGDENSAAILTNYWGIYHVVDEAALTQRGSRV